MWRLLKKKTGAKDAHGRNIRLGDTLISEYDDLDDPDNEIYTIYVSGVYPGAFWFSKHTKEWCDNYGCADYGELLGYQDYKKFIIISKYNSQPMEDK